MGGDSERGEGLTAGAREGDLGLRRCRAGEGAGGWSGQHRTGRPREHLCLSCGLGGACALRRPRAACRPERLQRGGGMCSGAVELTYEYTPYLIQPVLVQLAPPYVGQAPAVYSNAPARGKRLPVARLPVAPAPVRSPAPLPSPCKDSYARFVLVRTNALKSSLQFDTLLLLARKPNPEHPGEPLLDVDGKVITVNCDPLDAIINPVTRLFQSGDRTTGDRSTVLRVRVPFASGFTNSAFQQGRTHHDEFALRLPCRSLNRLGGKALDGQGTTLRCAHPPAQPQYECHKGLLELDGMGALDGGSHCRTPSDSNSWPRPRLSPWRPSAPPSGTMMMLSKF
eukprot:COSAG04_NODE_3643_length_2643_cov_1.584906_2_plen_339_part_00